jgi:hypothetical protein
VRQTFEWSTVDDAPFVSIETWVSSLSVEEQQHFLEARSRQDAYRQAAIDAGLLILDTNSDYIWRDKIAARQGKSTDEVWNNFFERWKKECGIILHTQIKEE